MGLSVRGDPSHPGGGYAILTSHGGELPSNLIIEDRFSEQFLNEAGQWTRKRVLLAVASIDAFNVRLGPAIVNAIASDLVIAFHSADGATFGELAWPTTVRPRAGAGGNGALPGRAEFDLSRKPIEPVRPPTPPPSPKPPPVFNPPASGPLGLKPPTAEPPARGEPAAPAPKPPPVQSKGRWRTYALILGGLLVLLVAFALLRDSPLEQGLVCPGGGLSNLELYGLLAPCHQVVNRPVEPPTQPDPEEAAYSDFLRCAVGKSGCAARDCANTFISLYPHGKHYIEIDGIRRAADQECSTRDKEAREGQINSDLLACLAGKSDCEKYACFDQFQGSLTIDRYVSSTRQMRQDAAVSCKSQRQFAFFSSCVAQSGPCLVPDCDQRFGSSLHTGPHAAEVQRILDDARASCVPPPPSQYPQPPPGPTPEQAAKVAARDFVERFYRIHSEKGEGPSGSFDDLYGSTVTVKGIGAQAELKSGSKQAEAKRAAFASLREANFKVDPDSETVSCDQSGESCEVRAVVTLDYTKAGRARSYTYRINFKIDDVLNRPHVTYEETAKLE